MWSRKFWVAATERALKTACQAVLGLFIGNQVFDVWTFDAKRALGVFIGGLLVSYLTSVASMPVGGNGPSVTTTEQLT